MSRLIFLFIGMMLAANAQEVADLESKLIHHPHDTALLSQVAAGYAAQKNYKKAAEYYALAATHVEKPQEAAQLLANQGACLAQTKQLEAALDVYKKALELDEHQKRARHNIPILTQLLEKKPSEKRPGKKPEKSAGQEQDQKGDQDNAPQQSQDGQQSKSDDQQRQDKDQAHDTHDGQQQKKKNVQHTSHSAKDSDSLNGDKQSDASQQPEALDKKPLNKTKKQQAQAYKQQVSADELQKLQEYLNQENKKELERQADSRKKVGENLWRWILRVEEHEKLGQQMLVDYQAKQVEHEVGAKNW